MPSTYSPSLRLELIGSGEQDGTWGATTNINLGSLIEQAITGVITITMVDADHVLTSFNGLPDEARNAVLVINGVNTTTRNVIAPSAEKCYIVKNISGAPIVIKTATGTGVTIASGSTQIVFCDGTNFYLASGVVAGTGITVSGATVSLSNTTVAAGTYPAATVTVDAQGRITSASATILGTMANQNANGVSITGGSVTGTTLNNNTITGGTINALATTSIGTNSFGTRTVSTSAPTGGVDGDVWYQIS